MPPKDFLNSAVTQSEKSLEAYKGQLDFNRFDHAPSSPNTKIFQLAIIGNSLALHGPAISIGWPHNHGMAATAQSADYAHRLADYLGIPHEQMLLGNFAELEREPIGETETRARVEEVFSARSGITILQLGDNVSTHQQLQAFCDNLCAIIPPIKAMSTHVLACSTWWASRPKDELIEKICDIFSIHYVYIGDIFQSPENADRKMRRFDHDGVNDHPGDWGMEQLARRLYASITNAKTLIKTTTG